MTTHDRDKIIAAAKEAGFDIWIESVGPIPNWIEYFYAIAFEAGRKAEREECAKVCEKERVAEDATHNREDAAYNMAIDHVAAAIRARGDTK